MSIDNHALTLEFPQFHARITTLKTSDRHFARQFDEYHELDREIRRLEGENVPVADETIEDLKKKRVALKDELYRTLAAG